MTMSANKGKKIGLLGVVSSIRDFDWDETKFLCGLTEKEFWKAAKTMTQPVDGNNIHERFVAIIHNLQKQEKKDSVRKGTYRGTVEEVVFNMAATFAQYDAPLEKISKYLEGKHRKTIHEPPTDAFLLYLGNKTITAYNPEPGFLRDKLLLKDISKMSLLDGRLHAALFNYVEHTQFLYPVMTDRAYKVEVLSHQTPRKVNYQALDFYNMEHQQSHSGKGTLGLVKLTFDVPAKIQYTFTPACSLNGAADELERFGLRT